MTPLKIAGSVIGVVVLILLIVLGGWRLGWWMNARGTDYQNHIFQHSYGTQTAYIEQLNQSVVDIANIDAQIAGAFVYTVTGPAVWNAKTHDVEMTGPSSFAFKTK